MDTNDILHDLGHLALASRLKRLADILQADAAKVYADYDQPYPQGQFALIAALDRYGPMSVNDMAKILGISQPATTRAVSEAIKTGMVVSTQDAADKRFRKVSLTQAGQDNIQGSKLQMWPRVEAAAHSLTSGVSGDFLEQVSAIEQRLAEKSMFDRVRENTLSIRPYTDELAPYFHDINKEWIEAMYTLEQVDLDVLENPRAKIIDPGGYIYFVQMGEGEIVGTCAVKKDADGYYELTKMGVRASARGQGTGAFLLRAVLERARELGCQDKLYLLSNKRNGAAVKLYERFGFAHSEVIMERFGSRYERCDVAMLYTASKPAA